MSVRTSWRSVCCAGGDCVTGAGPRGTTTARVEFGGRSFDIEVLEAGCAVSRHLMTSGRFYEEQFLSLLAEIVPADTVAIDVGAHIGNHSRFFSDAAGFTVLAIEPNPLLLPLLRRNLAASRSSIVVESAVSDRVSEVTMHQASNDDVGTNAIVERNEPGEPIVAARPLDEIWSDCLASESLVGPIGLIKIDVEGHELSVLRGARGVIEQHLPLITTEVRDASDIDEIARLLADFGYMPRGTFNPTPTVVWTAEGGVAGDVRSLQIIAGAASRRSVEVTDRLNRVSAMVKQSTAPAPAPAPAPHRDFVLFLSSGRHDHTLGERSDVETVLLRDPRSSGWRSRGEVMAEVAAAFKRRSAGECVVVADFDAAISSLVDLVVRGLGVRYTLLFSADAEIAAGDFELVNGASRRVILSRSVPAWAESSIFDYVVGTRWRTTDLVPARRPSAVDRLGESEGSDERVRVAIVSYYGPPVRSVAVNRVVFWNNNLAAIAEEMGRDFDVDLVAASLDDVTHGETIQLPDRGGWDQEGSSAHRTAARIRSVQLDTIGVHWGDELVVLADHYDCVVLSGNPFYFFSSAAELRRRGAKVVLDFRDPFAHNPRLRRDSDQAALLAELEHQYVESADHIVSVNQTCLDLIAPGAPVPRTVVPNGFDDEAFAGDRELRSPERRPVVAVAGRIYPSHDPSKLLSVLAQRGLRFVHVGPSDDRVEQGDLVSGTGWLALPALATLLQTVDLGVVFTNGDPFESTTKVFDYVGANLEILVVTDGEPGSGELGGVLAGLDGVWWVRNDAAEIDEFFSSYQPVVMNRSNRLDFSRRAFTRRLVDVISAVRTS